MKIGTSWSVETRELLSSWSLLSVLRPVAKVTTEGTKPPEDLDLAREEMGAAVGGMVRVEMGGDWA